MDDNTVLSSTIEGTRKALTTGFGRIVPRSCTKKSEVGKVNRMGLGVGIEGKDTNENLISLYTTWGGM